MTVPENSHTIHIMMRYSTLWRIGLAAMALLLALTACGPEESPAPLAVEIPTPTPYPLPLEDLFPTPTADLFDFLLITPTSTPETDVQPPAPTPTIAAMLPETGGETAAPPNLIDRLGPAGLVATGMVLVILGLLRMRR